MKSSFAFVCDWNAWRATFRLGWAPLYVYAAFATIEALNPLRRDTPLLSFETIPWSGLALAFVAATAMRVRAFGVDAKLSRLRLFSLGCWAVVWTVLIGAILTFVAIAITALPISAVALLPDATRNAVLLPFRESDEAAHWAFWLLAGVIVFMIALLFARLYLIVPAAVADRAVDLRGAWKLGRGNGRVLLGLLVLFMVFPEVLINTMADEIGAAAGSVAVGTAVYSLFALVTNQWAAAAWMDIHRALAEEEPSAG